LRKADEVDKEALREYKEEKAGRRNREIVTQCQIPAYFYALGGIFMSRDIIVAAHAVT
jgi:hypothetical protein